MRGFNLEAKICPNDWASRPLSGLLQVKVRGVPKDRYAATNLEAKICRVPEGLQVMRIAIGPRPRHNLNAREKRRKHEENN